MAQATSHAQTQELLWQGQYDLQTPTFLIRPARWIAISLVFLAFSMTFAPWQQTAVGRGQVAAYAPADRQQVVQAPIKGRIVQWFVVEGTAVKEGDPIVEIVDIDPNYGSRLERNRRAIEDRLQSQVDQAEAYEEQTKAYSEARTLAVQAAGLKVKMGYQKVRAAEQKLAAAKAAALSAQQNWERKKKLFDEGLASTRSIELAEASKAKTAAGVNSAIAALLEAKALRTALKAEQLQKGAEALAKVSSAQASSRKASADAAKAKESLAKIETELARQSSRMVRAPRSGTVLHAVGNEGGGVVKVGDLLAVLIPDTQSRAVELWIDGNDAPLVTKGRKVRLQFEGWPAVQFSGWPSVAVGTFGGKVAFVDATSRKNGDFRVLILPDEEDEAWPDSPLLRQGVRAQGWLLLDEVRLGYELWRRFNGFPATVSEPKDGGKPTKKKGA